MKTQSDFEIELKSGIEKSIVYKDDVDYQKTSNEVLVKIKSLLNINNFEFLELHHEELVKSEEELKRYYECMYTEIKSMLIYLGDRFELFALNVSKKIDLKKIKKLFKVKNVRFATVEELRKLTNGLIPGSMAPFGEPILPFKLNIDESIHENSKVAFSTGSIIISISMKTEEYLKIANGHLLNFSQEN